MLLTWMLVIMLLGIGVFQLALALGAPLGEMAWGGQYKGKLPDRLRAASASSLLILCLFVIATLIKGGVIATGADTFFGYVYVGMIAYFVIGIIVNAVSRSKLERWWAPYSAMMAVLAIVLLIRS